MNMVQTWKMLQSQQPVRKRYLQKQTSILSRGRNTMMAVAARVAEAGPAAAIRRAAWRAGRRREGRSLGGATVEPGESLGMAGQLMSPPWPVPALRAPAPTRAACATTAPYPRTPRTFSPESELYSCRRLNML